VNRMATLVEALQAARITDISNIIVFGSFVRTAATRFNDIDIWLDVDPSPETLDEIRDRLMRVGLKYGPLLPQYYVPSPPPRPFPPTPRPTFPRPPFPPFPKEEGYEHLGELHLTVCTRSAAERQAFFETLRNGPHLYLGKRADGASPV